MIGETAQLAIVMLAVLASAAYLLRGWWRSRCLRGTAEATAPAATCGACRGCAAGEDRQPRVSR